MTIESRENVIKSNLVVGYLSCFILIVPAFAWVIIDKSAFGGDQSQYAKEALTLYDSWSSLSLWLEAMINSMGFKAPGIIWIGQLFIPFGRVIGSIDDALLFSIVITLFVTFLLVFKALWLLSKEGYLVPLAGCMILTVSPLFQYLSHHYLVEPMQLLSVAWFVLIMAAAPKLYKASVLAQLVAAASFAVLAKVSSPFYCIGPGLVSLSVILGKHSLNPHWGWRRPSTIVMWIVALTLGIATAFWYYQNIFLVVNHVAAVSSGPIAEVWGKEDTFFNSLAYWVDTVRRVFFLKPVIILSSAFVVVGLCFYLLKPDRRHKYFTLCCLVSCIQIVLVLSIFSFGSNREPRYLLALLPYVALSVGWGMFHVRNKITLIAANGVLGVTWMFIVGYSLLALETSSLALPNIARVDKNTDQSAILQEIIDRTCAAEICINNRQTPCYNIIAIDPTLKGGDWLAPDPANYVLHREHLDSQQNKRCSYGYMGDSFFGNNSASSWFDIIEKRPDYILTFDPDVYPPSLTTFNQSLNTTNFPYLFERIKSSGFFEALPPLLNDPGIVVFRASEDFPASIEPKTKIEETRLLFDTIYAREPGDIYGLVEMRDTGILIHPGANTPTKISFDVAGKYEVVNIMAFMETLPSEAISIDNAGTVGIDFLIDGSSVGYATVDRFNSYRNSLNLNGAGTLTIVVDNGDGQSWYDWLILVVE